MSARKRMLVAVVAVGFGLLSFVCALSCDVEYGDCSGVDVRPIYNGVRLDVYSDGGGTLLDVVLISEWDYFLSPFTISATDPAPYYDPPQLYVIATRANCYTKIIPCQPGDAIDMSFIPAPLSETPNDSGVVVIYNDPFIPVIVSNTVVSVTTNGTDTFSFRTDELGRFFTSNEFRFTVDSFVSFEFESLSYTGYKDEFIIFNNMQTWRSIRTCKPVVYLYPETETQIDVDIDFPQKGYISRSIPPYRTGWTVTADPSGRIDGQYDYLYYSSYQPNGWQMSFGWLVAGADVETFFRGNLAAYGFNAQEIDDFVEYWVRLLDDYPYYAVYPQTSTQIDPLIRLTVSPQPDKVLRLFYTIIPEQSPISISAPTIPTFERSGFTVTEWGGSLELRY
ncbi:MAG: hypothetical protein ABIH86_02980 [Planctomycetota bacterium]